MMVQADLTFSLSLGLLGYAKEVVQRQLQKSLRIKSFAHPPNLPIS